MNLKTTFLTRIVSVLLTFLIPLNLWMSFHPGAKIDPNVKEVLENSANDISTSGRDVYTGHGNVNAQKAVAMAAGIKAKADKATLGKVTAKAKASDGNIAVSWSAVKDAKNYVIFKKGPDDKDYTQAVSVSKDETSWTDSSCVAGKEYSYKVMAASTSDDGKKIKGEMSDPVSAKAASKTTD